MWEKIIDIIDTVATTITIIIMLVELTRMKWQAKLNLQIETLSGIYECVSVIRARQYWPQDLSDLDDSDNFHPAPKEILQINLWLTNPYAKEEDNINSGEKITLLYTKRLWVQTKNLWPKADTKEVIDFLECYHKVLELAAIAINGFGVEHPSPTSEQILYCLNNELLPSYHDMMKSKCLVRMEESIHQGKIILWIKKKATLFVKGVLDEYIISKNNYS